MADCEYFIIRFSVYKDDLTASNTAEALLNQDQSEGGRLINYLNILWLMRNSLVKSQQEYIDRLEDSLKDAKKKCTEGMLICVSIMKPRY